MATILLVAAEAMEFAGLLRRLPAAPARWPVRFARVAERGKDRLLMAANGAGWRLAAEAAEAALRAGRPDVIASVGYCGALDPGLRAGDLVIGDRVRTHGQEEVFEARLPFGTEGRACGTIISIDRFVQTADDKRRLRCSGAVAVEMEAAGVARVARGFGLPFVCVRAVTDEAEEGFQIDFNAARDASGRIRRGRIAAQAVLRPWRTIPELLGLYRRCRRASDVLGEFLADSRFQL